MKPSSNSTELLFVQTACDSACNDGLMRCHGQSFFSCCNFYSNSECVDECPSPFMPNSDYVCDCPVGTTGSSCEDGNALSLCCFLQFDLQMLSVMLMTLKPLKTGWCLYLIQPAIQQSHTPATMAIISREMPLASKWSMVCKYTDMYR